VPGEVALYDITVVDAAGQRVVDGAPAVTVKVKGGGRLIGLDTSDLGYAGRFKTNTRKATNGHLLATVQRTGAPGEGRLTATAWGLAGATAAITAVGLKQ
jgi:cell division GTPase FtsZ